MTPKELPKLEPKPVLFGTGETKPAKQQKGFAVMSKAQRKRIATLGGLAVSQDRARMQRIGRKGGKNSHGTAK